MPRPRLRIFWYWLSRWACRLFCILFFRLRVYGRENVPTDGPFLLVSNHQSYLDPLFCGVAVKRQLDYLARESLFGNPFFRLLILSLNSIPVKRGQADLSAIKAVIARLRQGHAVCLFPEATRTPNGRIAPFKGGVGLLAKRGGAPIVPVVIDGAYECWPRHKKIFSPGGQITVCYGKAVPAERIEKMDNKELAELLTKTLRRMQCDCRIRQGKEPYSY
ncbi:MAG TPA: lysophospholipid acyltransferase family protein [Sedimentisphaerales bacterium]|nr:lysophospholipid acyltransferase family protein [Sedimentisphaerales bacterium]